MITKVVHCKRDPYDIYIGRPGPLGNPYSHMSGTLAQFRVATREEAIEKHMEYLRAYPEDKLRELLSRLKGKTLGCWCSPKACHGDNFVKLIKELDI